ncbi:MAG TPA: hypothetical protein VMU92_03035 [Acidobacteriaceae bacterium]|nr:hypothetical protein [Acidobacteriaceae bacterium]
MPHSEFQSEHFASEGNEATWWNQHQGALAEEFNRAAARPLTAS